MNYFYNILGLNMNGLANVLNMFMPHNKSKKKRKDAERKKPKKRQKPVIASKVSEARCRNLII
jgi:Na+-transporting methylmalonyl-CoA/oxaloacetate decarboxylase gamma subunit